MTNQTQIMYQVIVVRDDNRGRDYYYTYAVSSDTALGNIECDELPPYADANKARACYWDADASAWVYDADKYAAIVAEQDAAAAAAEQAQREAAAVPSNAELAEAVMEIAASVSDIMDALSELAALVSEKKGVNDDGKDLS